VSVEGRTTLFTGILSMGVYRIDGKVTGKKGFGEGVFLHTREVYWNFPYDHLMLSCAVVSGIADRLATTTRQGSGYKVRDESICYLPHPLTPSPSLKGFPSVTSREGEHVQGRLVITYHVTITNHSVAQVFYKK
jgi:hypothetical protein